MPNTYVGTAAGLNGRTITSFNPGDQIEITDETPTYANVTISGDTLQYTGGSITIDNLGPGRYVIRALGSSGTDIRLQQDAHNDFSGDGMSDVLWRNDSGTVTDWVSTGSGFAPNTAADGTFNVPTSWHIVGTGDFNGDGHEDILWHNDNGLTTDWFGTMSGGFTTTNNWTASVPTNWQVVGVGDFNADGHSDILWRDTNTGTITDWFATASGGFTTANNWTASVPTNWKVVGVGDFNGDGHSDILWRDTNTGALADWLGSGTGLSPNNDPTASANVPTNWQVLGVGDFNGDGNTDILWRDTNTGTITDWLGNANGGFTPNTDPTASATVPTNWQVASVGDFNGDGHSDILWRDGNNGTLTDWFGTASGGFTTANDWTGVPSLSWHVQDPLV